MTFAVFDVHLLENSARQNFSGSVSIYLTFVGDIDGVLEGLVVGAVVGSFAIHQIII